MSFFFLKVGRVEGFFFKHYELPLHGVEHIEFDLINFVFGFCVNKKVLMVEEGIDKEVGTIFDIVDSASRWLDEHILRNVSFAFPQQHPAVKPFSQIKVRSQFVRFIVVDRQCFLG